MRTDDTPPAPVHRPGVTFICEAPPGAQLFTVNERVYLAAPGHPVSEVTPTGLVPVPFHDIASSAARD